MDDIFPFVNPEELLISEANLKGLLKKQSQIHLTGLIQIECPQEKRLSLLFVLGEAVNVYLSSADESRKFPLERYATVLGNTQNKARILKLPLEGIRLSKMMLETSRQVGTFQIQTADFVRRFDGWSTSPETIIVLARWPRAEAILVFPGNSAPVQPILFSRNGHISTELDAMAEIHAWKEPTCSIMIFSMGEDTDAWQEYHLHLIFIRLAEQILTRYNEIAGTILVSVLNQEIDDETLRRGWRISCVGNGIHDHHIFSSPQEAGQAYHILSRFILKHLNLVLGSKIAASILREVTDGLDQESRALLEEYQLLDLTEEAIFWAGGRSGR